MQVGSALWGDLWDNSGLRHAAVTGARQNCEYQGLQRVSVPLALRTICQARTQSKESFGGPEFGKGIRNANLGKSSLLSWIGCFAFVLRAQSQGLHSMTEHACVGTNASRRALAVALASEGGQRASYEPA